MHAEPDWINSQQCRDELAEAEADVAAGRTESFEDVESLIASLDGDDNAQRDMPSLPRKR